ncbi:MAG: putative esterase/lipase/thioesterase family protein [Streblomastix strix]|uniref:Maspardin n=1 Tax=Streblomastix strix TaxID=222440 RepID=A0A5J4UIJ4_9EUKA|nr:MAG: putative esterase/lipase/thioesterase family protein [Streblomastix strix]
MFWKKRKETPPETLQIQKDFTKFRSVVPLQRASVGLERRKVWKFYDCGDEQKMPVVLIPPAGGTAELFFRLFLDLPSKGIRLIAVQAPPFTDHDDWIAAFHNFLDHINLKRIHLIGAGLGGFLALLYARMHHKRVYSMILINSFSSNVEFAASPEKYEFTPSFALRKLLCNGVDDEEDACTASEKEAQAAQKKGITIKQSKHTPNTMNAAASSFVKEQMESMTQEELYASLCLQCREAYVDKNRVNTQRLTIIETDDITQKMADTIESCRSLFRTARLVTLKSGGVFPYISVSDEICLHIMVHMRRLDASLLPELTAEEGNVGSVRSKNIEKDTEREDKQEKKEEQKIINEDRKQPIEEKKQLIEQTIPDKNIQESGDQRVQKEENKSDEANKEEDEEEEEEEDINHGAQDEQQHSNNTSGQVNVQNYLHNEI